MLTSKICLSESNLKVVTEKVFLQYDFHEVIGSLMVPSVQMLFGPTPSSVLLEVHIAATLS